MNNKYDLLIIGGGPVGIFCAFLAHNKGLKPLIIEANSSFGGQPNILYSQKEVHDYPGFKSIKAYEIFNMLLQQFNSVKIDNFVNTTLKQCNFFNKSFNIELSNEKKVNASNIVLACGNGIFNPNKLEIKTNNKIHYIVKPFEFYKNKKVIILGGGDSAVDWANELAINAKCKNISIIHRRNEFRANGTNVLKLNKNKVKVYLNSIVHKINNQFIILDNKIKIPYDYVIVQYGQKIEQNIFQNFKNLKTQNNKVIVGLNHLTNINNIYAVGDICYYDNKPYMIITGLGEASIVVNDIVKKTKNYSEVFKK